MGVLIYRCLSGFFPFYPISIMDSKDELFKLIKSGVFDFKKEEFKNVSEEAKEFIKKLLVVDTK
jgi:hypothetical protein